jgi:hypothetical protein
MPTSAARPKPTLPTAVTGVAQTKEFPIPLSTTSIGKDTVASTASSAARVQPGPDAPINTRFTAESGSTVLNNRSRAGSSLPINHSGVIPAADTTPANTAPTILQTLLHRVSNLADTNAARVKQWFEFASLIRAAKTESTLTPSIEAIQTLKQLNDPESFMRELTQTIQLKLKSQAGDDAPTTKSLPQETLLQHARDGIKLVEQSLSQNLLQRASLGMQQETQQALSFSFALPFLDGQEVKPFHIDLAQRVPAQQDSDQGWDIRLSFEFAGLGAISCHIFLEGMTVAVSFYSEQNQTRNRIELALPELKQQLSSAGFSSGEFHSFAGIKDQVEPSTTTRFSESLIDLEA